VRGHGALVEDPRHPWGSHLLDGFDLPSYAVGILTGTDEFQDDIAIARVSRAEHELLTALPELLQGGEIREIPRQPSGVDVHDRSACLGNLSKKMLPRG
jgi:hypothetical protein